VVDSKLEPKIRASIEKSLNHLDYSFKKVQKIPLDRPNWSEEQLEVLESFASRFARSSDLIVSRFLRLKALQLDPAFRGSIIDLLNLAEKHQLVTSAKTWHRIRELRNVAAHEYEADDLIRLYQELVALTPTVLAIRSTL
jgi:hypothetical protein